MSGQLGALIGNVNDLKNSPAVSGDRVVPPDGRGVNNPGNLKNPDGSWASFPTPEAGLAAIPAWFDRAQDVHGLTTPRQLIDDPKHGYASSAAPGNAGKDLVGQFAARLGVGPDDPIDVHDPAIRQRIIPAIQAQEGTGGGGAQPSSGQAATDSDVRQLYNQRLSLLQRQYAAAASMPTKDPAQKMLLLDSIQGRMDALLVHHPDVVAAEAEARRGAEQGVNLKYDPQIAAATAWAKINPELKLAAGRAGIDLQKVIAEAFGKPEKVTTQSPTGAETTQFVTPAQAQAGPPLVTKQPAAVQDQIDAAKKDYGETAEAAKKAQESRLPLQAIGNAMEAFRTGPSAETRLQLFRSWQDFAQTIHLPQSDDLSKMIASGETITKEGTQLGYELARTLGSREAQMIVQQAINSNPGLFNSPAGNKQLISLIRSSLQRDEDRRQFFDDWAAGRGGGSFVGAAPAFAAQHPAEAYINRVIPPRQPPQGVPQGSAYNGARGMWRDQQGNLYNAAGVRISQ